MNTSVEPPPLPLPDERQTALIENPAGEKPVFSAFEVGRTTIVRETLQAQTGYSFSLPLEDQSPAEIFELYQAFPKLDFLPVRNESGWITGYLTRKTFFASLSESQFSRDLLFRREARLHHLINRHIICLNAHTSLTEASEILMQRPDHMRFDPFVVTLNRRFFGISTIDRVMRGINYFLTREMEAVRDAQFRIMEAPGAPDIDNAVRHHISVQPFQGPGGDFARVYELNERFSIAMLFDVCGKGVKAAAMVSVLGTLFHKLWKDLQKHPTFTLRVLEKELFRLNNDLTLLSSVEMYATGVVLLIDKQSYILSVFDYGHGMLWLRRNQRVHQLQGPRSDTSIPFLGITENLRMQPFSFRIKRGDILFSCSDGILEQLNPAKEAYGSLRTIEALRKAGEGSPAGLCNQILNDWNTFRAGAPIRDDLSILLLQID